MSSLVSIILVNYNGRRFLPDCLDALARQRFPAWRTEVLLVDNASTDDSLSFVRQHYPWVRIVESTHNRGFAAGNNLGVSLARGQWVVLLNTDTIPEPTWLAELVHAAEHTDALGLASRLLFPGEPARINSTGLVLYRDGRGADRGEGELDCGQYDQDGEVFGGCGASLLIRRDDYLALGGLDERLFMYYEDLDFAWRARLRGGRFRYVPRSVVRHLQAGSAGSGSPFQLYHIERSRTIVALKNAPAALAAYALAGCLARCLRACWRVRRLGLARTLAHWRAAASVLWHLPAVCCDRLRLRWFSHRVGDAAIRRWMIAPPKPQGASV